MVGAETDSPARIIPTVVAGDMINDDQ